MNRQTLNGFVVLISLGCLLWALFLYIESKEMFEAATAQTDYLDARMNTLRDNQRDVLKLCQELGL
jgi:hypothetical protein